MVRHVILGALVTGLAPLTGAGLDAAAAGASPAALCQSMFGDTGPVGGPVVGEGPSGDPMRTTIGWEPSDWSDGLSEIVTCVSVGGRAASGLTRSIPAPRNDGSREISLTLPLADRGALVCEQSVLVGAGDAAGRHRTTSPVCFKLRAAEPPLDSRGSVANKTISPVPDRPVSRPVPGAAATPPTAPTQSTPPARAAFEAARSGTGTPVAGAAIPDPLASVAVPTPAWPDPVATAPAAKGAPPAVAASTPAAPASPAGAPVTALARTGIDEKLPLASAGGFLALGGAAIIFGSPRRRRS